MSASFRNVFCLLVLGVLVSTTILGQERAFADSREIERRHQEVRKWTHQVISRLNSLYKNGNVDEALDLATQALGKDRLNYYERFVFWRWIGDLRYWNGDYDGWTSAYEEAISLAERLEPKTLQFSLLFDLSQEKFRQGKYDAAALYMKKWRNRSHIIWPPHYIYVAQISYARGHYANAAKAVALAVSVGEGQKLAAPLPHWLDLAANAYWHAENFEAAFYMLNKKLELWPETADDTCGKMASLVSSLYSIESPAALNKVRTDIANCAAVTHAERFDVLEISEPESPIWGEKQKGETYCTPMVVAVPEYPRSAERKGISGHLAVRFNVDDAGWVAKDTIEIMSSVPEGAFDEAAFDALSKFRFHLISPGFDQTCRQNVSFLFSFIGPRK